MRTRYADYIKLNKNIILSFFIALATSALVAHLLTEHESHINSTYTTAVDFVVFYSSFSLLYYLDNRKKYRLEDNSLDKKQLKKDLAKIISSLGAGEIVYIGARWYFQFYLLNIQFEPYLASITAHIVSTLVYLIVVNLGVRITKLYKHDA